MSALPDITLTMALALVACLVVAGLLAHAVWTSRRSVARAALGTDLKKRSHGPADGLQHRIEPAFDADTPAVAVPGTAAEFRAPSVRRPGRLDPLIDAIAPLTLEAPVTGEAALSHLPSSRRAGSKPFLIEGLNAETGEWEAPQPGQHYGEFQAGVQMASRNGALNEIEYSEFVQKVQAFADGIGALAEFPDMLDVVARARELDAFAAPHDAQLSVILRANTVAWSVGYVQQSAARHGFVAGTVPGRLVLPGAEAGAPPVLVMTYDAQAALQEDPNLSALREVSLVLDVAQTPESAEPFGAWQQSARALADDMDAVLVDDQGQAITVHAFAAIGQELQVLYRSLEARDLAAGTPTARRLFT